MKKLYHLSKNYLGETKIFTPRVPENRWMGNCEAYNPFNCSLIEEDEKFKRICVSPYISGCYRALDGDDKFYNDYYVYQAVDPEYVSRDLPLMLVSDAKKTGEHWILNKTKFKRIGRIEGSSKKWRWIEKNH